MTKSPLRASTLAGALVLSAWALAAGAHAGGQVTGVRVARLASGVEVSVTGSALSRPAASLSPDGTSYRLDFDAPLKGLPMSTQTGFASVPKVGIVWISKKPAKIRVSLAVGPGAKPVLAANGVGAWKVVVPNAKSAKPIVLKTISPKPGVAKAGATKPVLAKAPSSAPSHVAPAMPRVPWSAPVPRAAAPAPVVAKTAPKVVKTPKTKVAKAPRVTLDFSNTDVRQVLKLLALQTKSNIVTSNGVKGDPISLSLHDVTTEQALNLVCTAANLRYTHQDGSYIVTTKAGYQEATRGISGDRDEAMVTRVVPIYSGEGQQVKAAVLKATGGDNARGRFELFLPSEEISFKQTQDVTPEGKAKEDSAELEIKSGKNGKDGYIVVVGTPSRLDEVAELTHKIDAQICVALGRSMPDTPALYTKVYNVRGSRAGDLVAALAGPNANRLGGVSMLATPSTSISRQTVLLQGREDEVLAVYASLEQLDANDTAAPEFSTVELSFADPRAMREMLLSNVPGLAVTIPPASVGNPRLFREDETRRQSEQRGTELPAPQGGGTNQANQNQNQNQNQGGSQTQSVSVGGDNGALSGLQQPYKDYEAIAVPMRLVLRGTADQLRRGQEFIRALDIAPKHVAIELRVMELNREDALRAGLDFNLASGGAVKFARLLNTQNDFQDQRNTIGFNFGSKSVPLDVTATLDKLANKNNLISRPNTIALDGRETELFIGDVVRYIESIISSQNGVTVTTNSVRVGVRVAVLPRVGGDGNITMDLRPVVSFLRGFDNVQQIGGKLPQTSERVAQSSFNMKSGETIAISGLITDQDRRTVSGLPFLMDLPVVGQLFRKTTNERIRSELVIFVTARTIEGPLGSNGSTLPAQAELPGNKSFPGPNAGDVKSSRDKGGPNDKGTKGPN